MAWLKHSDKSVRAPRMLTQEDYNEHLEYVKADNPNMSDEDAHLIADSAVVESNMQHNPKTGFQEFIPGTPDWVVQIAEKRNWTTEVGTETLDESMYPDVETFRKNWRSDYEKRRGSYGDKRDHPKIEIFVGGEYKATTTWASSCAEAKEKYLADHPEIEPSTVSCSFAPKKGSLKSASYEGLNPGEQSEARELELYADNTSEIYPLKESIILNIARKIKRGVYDPALAPKLWRYWIDAAAKRYAQEFATPDFSFSTKVRQAVADEYARNEYEMIMNGEYSDYLGKNGIELATPEEQEVPPTLSSLRTEAGLTTQIRSLKKRLDKLNINKCNPSEIKGVVDALEALEKRLEAEKVRKQKRLDAKESSDDDLEKEATSDEAQKWISSKIEKLINEGKSKEQAAAIAYSMAREKGFSIPEKKSGLEAVATSMVAKVISPFEVTVDDQTQVVNEGEIIEITNIFPDFYEGRWQGKTVFVEPEIFDSLTEPAEGAEVYAEQETDTGDLVTCTNCEWSGEVARGEETCPKCGKTGSLAWTDEVKKSADQVPPAPPMESATPGNKWVMDPTTKQWTQVPESDQTVEMKATASLKVEAVKDEYSIFG